MSNFPPFRAPFRPRSKNPSAPVASARPIELIIFGDTPLEVAVARAIPKLGWLAEIAPEHISVRRVRWVDPV
jgi:hypothetical protein